MPAVPAIWKTIALAAAFALLGVLLARWFQPPGKIEVIHLQPDMDCDLRAGPCTLSMDGGRKIRFGIKPRDIPVGKVLQLSVDLDGLDADTVSVDMNGVDMDMGLSPYPLKKKTARHFEGPGGLNFCSRGIMEWEARVRVSNGNREIIAPFRFITTAPDPRIPLARPDATSAGERQ